LFFASRPAVNAPISIFFLAIIPSGSTVTVKGHSQNCSVYLNHDGSGLSFSRHRPPKDLNSIFRHSARGRQELSFNFCGPPRGEVLRFQEAIVLTNLPPRPTNLAVFHTHPLCTYFSAQIWHVGEFFFSSLPTFCPPPHFWKGGLLFVRFYQAFFRPQILSG